MDICRSDEPLAITIKSEIPDIFLISSITISLAFLSKRKAMIDLMVLFVLFSFFLSVFTSTILSHLLLVINFKHTSCYPLYN